MPDDIELNIDQTVDDFIGEVAPGSEPPAAEPAAPAAAAVTSLAKPAPAGSAPESIAYPKSWKADLAPHWAKMPRELQDYVTNTREKDYLNGLEQYKVGHSAYSQIHEVLTPYMPRLTALNLQPAQAIQALMNADYRLAQGSETERYAAMAEICATYGLDPAKIVKSGGEQPFRTEGEIALAKQLDEQSRTIKAFFGHQTAQQRATIDKEVTAFAADPAHPYFNDCGDHIARLLTADKSLSLQDAYEQAVWANPTTRAKEIERTSKEAADRARKEREEAARKAASARAANIRGKPSAAGTGTAKGGWEEELPAMAAKIQSRA